MRLSKCFGVMAFLAVFLVTVAGSAWANVDAVIHAVNAYNGNSGGTGSLSASSSGSTVTITGAITGANRKLDLGNISGLRIDWKATLTGIGGTQDNRRYLLMMNASEVSPGYFDVTGGMIENTGPNENASGGWYYVISAFTRVNVTISGGYVRVAEKNAEAIQMSSDKITGGTGTPGEVVVKGGEVSAPNGVAIVGKTTLITPGKITGVVLSMTPDFRNISLDAYGNATTYAESTILPAPNLDWDKIPSDAKWTCTAKSGSVWRWNVPNVYFDKIDEITIEPDAEIIIENGCRVSMNGSINIKTAQTEPQTTVFSEQATSSIINGILRIYGNLEITRDGRVINGGTILNYSTGTIINEGKIENSKGRINNGGAFKSVQTASEMGGIIEGTPVQPLDDDSSSGCNSGFAIFLPVLIGVLAFTKKRIAKK